MKQFARYATLKGLPKRGAPPSRAKPSASPGAEPVKPKRALTPRTEPSTAQPQKAEPVVQEPKQAPDLKPSTINVVNDFRNVVRADGSRGAAHGKRTISKIVGITFHQTGTTDFSPHHSGLKNVPVHAMVHRDGSVSLLHSIYDLMYGGHALNGGTIHIEVAARAAGVEGDLSTLWVSKEEKAAGKRPEQLVAEATDAQLQALSSLSDFYIAEVANAGGKIHGIWAHRQGHSSRETDPGSRIWKVAIAVTQRHGLTDTSNMTLGSGKPIPESWK